MTGTATSISVTRVMNVLRGLLFDNLGLKLAALVLAVLVYLHVYTERPAHMTFAFPIQLADLDSTLALSGPVPSEVEVELRGTGKQLIRLRLSEPMLRVSLAGVARGRFERAITAEDLPLMSSEGIQVERIVGPRVIQLQLDRKLRRLLPVAPRVLGSTVPGSPGWDNPIAQPAFVSVTGPETAVAHLDSVVLSSVRVEGRRDTVRAQVAPAALPVGCLADPATVSVRVPMRRP
jgi:YbbR domain-containing protein